MKRERITIIDDILFDLFLLLLLACSQVLDVNNLKILDLGFNNIEELPAASLKTLHSLE